MTGHVDSISPEFASPRDSEKDDSVISGDDDDVSNFVANSLFRMVLSEQKITWPIDSSGKILMVFYILILTLNFR